MAWTAVTSSNLDAVDYDASTQTLWVRFKSGDIYEYDGVPKSVVSTLLSPPGGSHGRFFTATIRTRYPYRKI